MYPSLNYQILGLNLPIPLRLNDALVEKTAALESLTERVAVIKDSVPPVVMEMTSGDSGDT